MSSLSDAQQIHSLLQQISNLLDDIDIKTTKTEANSKKALTSINQLERVVLRYLVLTKRMGLPENVSNAINFIQQMIVTARMLHVSLTILEMSHPYTLPLAVAGITMTAITFQDSMMGYFT